MRDTLSVTFPEGWTDPDRREYALTRLAHVVANAELSPGDLLALRYMSHGLTEAETGDALGVGRYAIHDRIERCRIRLGCKTTTHAVAQALRQGLIP